MEVDYQMLSGQYASFLAAIGGVSITVLALVLSFGSKPSPFLVAALVVATVSCFTGAHMMAETAAYISYYKGEPSGERLFLLASINIFVGIILLIFALMLLPIESGKVDDAGIKLIPASVFIFVIIGTLYWMVLSAIYRNPAPQGWIPVVVAVSISAVWLLILLLLVPKESLLRVTFISILGFTLASLLWFAWTFKDGGKVRNIDIWLFSLAITSTCASLIAASMQSKFGEIRHQH